MTNKIHNNEYEVVLESALTALYTSMCFNKNSHPAYKELIHEYILNASKYADNNKDRIENLVLDSIIRSITAVFRKDNNNIFVSSKYLKDSLAKYTTIRSIEPHWTPFLDTISGLEYVGKAYIPRLSYVGIKTSPLIVRWDQFVDFDTNFQQDTIHGVFWKYFSCYDFSQSSFDQIIRIFSQNAIPCKEYSGSKFFSELCNIIIMNSNRTSLPSGLSCIDKANVIKLIENTIVQPNVLDIRSSTYFPIIAKYLEIPETVVRYFINSEPTVIEKTSYEESYLYGYDKTDLTRGTEQAEDDDLDLDEDEEDATDDDEPTDTDDDLDESDDEDTEDEDSDTEEDDSEDDDLDEDESEDEGTDTDPEEEGLPISEPQSISINLAGNQESLEDILYKTQVCEMVRGYKEDPPPELKLEELLLLEVWCTRWIFLVNAQTTKDLLSELSLTIGD